MDGRTNRTAFTDTVNVTHCCHKSRANQKPRTQTGQHPHYVCCFKNHQNPCCIVAEKPRCIVTPARKKNIFTPFGRTPGAIPPILCFSSLIFSILLKLVHVLSSYSQKTLPQPTRVIAIHGFSSL